MLSPLSAASPSNAAEMPPGSGTLVVSNTGLAIESPKPDSRTRTIRQSPFKVPEDNSIFLLRMKEKEYQKEEMRQYLALPVHERQTFTGRKQRELTRALIEQLDEEEGEKEKMDKLDRLKEKTVRPHSLPGKQALKMAMIKQENVEKESIQDFITKKREKFLQEYSLLVKRSEMKKLDNATVAEERRLKRAEQQLERDALLFEEFLKENNKNSVEAVKTAEQETQTKLQRIAENKRLTAEMVTIKSEISKNEEIMKDYNMYKDFLFKLSPPEWQEAQRAMVLAAKALQSDKDAHDKEKDHHAEIKPGHRRGVISTGRELPPIRECRSSSRHSTKSSANSRTPTPFSKLVGDSPEYEDEPELYFSEPQQLLNLLTELEEQNLSLIQNSTETEEALEELRRAMENSKRKMERDAAQLSSQIETMTETIAREKKRAAELDLKVRLFSFGKVKTEDQDSMLDALGRKVEEVYRSCVGDKKANLSTVQMLAHIENRVSTLLENIESIPADTLEKVERIKEKERRIRQREEKQQQQKQKQEERLRKSLERAQAVVKKKSGRKLMPRSKPVARKVKLNNVKDISDQEEINAYFFT